MPADLTGLIQARDQLNTDIAKFQTAANVDQATVDTIKNEIVQTDVAVVAAITPPVSTLNFTKFDASNTALAEQIKTLRAGFPALTQATVDALQQAMDALNAQFLSALGVK